MSINDIMTAIAKVESTITGVKKAYDKAPVALNMYPCFVNFPETGTIERSPSIRRTVHKVKLHLYVLKGADLPTSEAEVRPYLDSTLYAFDTHLTLFGFANTSRIVAYNYGILTYSGNPYLGIVFDLDVTEWTSLNFIS
jgi:hypothetical protein